MSYTAVCERRSGSRTGTAEQSPGLAVLHTFRPPAYHCLSGIILPTLCGTEDLVNVLQCLHQTPTSCTVQIQTLELLQNPTTSLPSLVHVEVQEQVNSEHVTLALSETNSWDLWDKLDSRSSVFSCSVGCVERKPLCCHGRLCMAGEMRVDREIAFL